MTNLNDGSNGGYYWANSEPDGSAVVDYELPSWFDAFCRMRFETEEIIQGLKDDGIENPIVDDLILDIDFRLDDLFGSNSKNFVIYDSHGEEW